MTARARLVPQVPRHLLDAHRVTASTGHDIAERELESVRLVARGAGGALVRAVIGFCELVTRRAGAYRHAAGGERRIRMRIVAAHATTRCVGVVRVNVFVARGAGRGRRRPDIVRSVTVGAAVVRSDASRTNHVDLRVTAATRRSLLFLELVRFVATDALRVPARKQRCRRNHGLLFCVTRDTRSERFFGRGVSMLVTGGAGFNQ